MFHQSTRASQSRRPVTDENGEEVTRVGIKRASGKPVIKTTVEGERKRPARALGEKTNNVSVGEVRATERTKISSRGTYGTKTALKRTSSTASAAEKPATTRVPLSRVPSVSQKAEPAPKTETVKPSAKSAAAAASAAAPAPAAAPVTVAVPAAAASAASTTSQGGKAQKERIVVSEEAVKAITARLMKEHKMKLAEKKPVQGDWDDLDALEADDHLMETEYAADIFEYMRELEESVQPNPNYMDDQKDLHWKMRGILNDWIIDVHAKFHLLPETLFLAINMIDRFLSLRTVSMPKLQLVGVVALLLASKYEETMSPSIQNFIYMTDGGYKEEEVLRAERYMLSVLDFNLSFPSPLNFLRRASKADQYDLSTRTLAKFLLEIPLVDHRFLCYPWSQISAAAMWMARRMMKRGPWTPNMRHFSGYEESELIPVVKLMWEFLRAPVTHESLYRKYAHKKLLKASLHAREWAARRTTFDLV